jgi:hypothetical protein
MANGVSTDNIDSVPLSDAVLVNRDGSTAQQPTADLAAQIAGSDAISGQISPLLARATSVETSLSDQGNRLTSLEDGAYADAIPYATSAAGIAATVEGQRFKVDSADPDVAYDVYLHDAGDVATFVSSQPSTSALSVVASLQAVDVIAASDLRQGSLIVLGEDPAPVLPLEVDLDGYVISERRNPLTGPFPFVTELHTGDGQSNAEAQAQGLASQVFDGLAYKNRPRMPMTDAADVWLGLRSSGGSSVELASGAITGLTALVDTLPTTSYGTTEASSAARSYTARVNALTGWTPDVITWVNAEGGEYIDNMMPDAPSGEYYYQNAIMALTDVASHIDGLAAWTWSHMNQGENDSAQPDLGADHNALRAHFAAEAKTILGQTLPLRMTSIQPSSFYNNSDGAQSILDEALADIDGVFFCAGPSYIYPWAGDYLHHTSVGHAMSGHMRAWIMESVLRGGAWLPLHMVNASVTGAYEITVTMSEPIVIDEGWLVDATGLQNHGITVTGATISSITVSGSALVITTSDAASGASEVGIALVGHAVSPRAADKIPRSTVRSVARWTNFHTGDACHKPASHQAMPVS